MKAAGSSDERRYVSRRVGDQILAAAEADLRRRVRRMAREIAPRLAMKSRMEIWWIYRAAVHALCDEVDQIWRAKIAAMPTLASRGVSVVSPPEGQRCDGGRP